MVSMTEQTVVLGGEPAWDITVSYEIGDAVTHADQTWQAREANVAVVPGTDTAVWMQMAGGFDLETYYTLLADVIAAGEASAATAAGNALHDTVMVHDLPMLAADTTIEYGTGSPVFVQPGHLVRTSREGLVYVVADPAATDHQVTTPGGVKLYVEPVAGEIWDRQWFDIADDATRVQAAIDFSVKYQLDKDAPIKVKVFGQYTMNKPIGLYSFDGSQFRYASVHLEAPVGGYINNQRTTFTFTDGQNPGIVVQRNRNSVIRNISIKGAANSGGLPSYQSLLDRDSQGTPWWNTSGAVESGLFKYHAGIVLDLFHSGQPASEKFSYYDGSTPDVPDHYVDGTGTTEFLIDNCEIQGWVIGVNTSGSAIQLGDSITVRDSNFSSNRIAMQIGESQNRGVLVQDCHGKGHDIILAAGSGFGTGTGAGCYVRGGVWVFNYALVANDTNRGNGAFTDVYAESTWTVGHISGTFGFTFKDCNIKLIDGVESGLPGPDAVMTGSGRVQFIGGFIGHYANFPRKLAMTPSVSFRDCTMSSPPVFNPDIMPVFDNVEFRNENTQKAGMFVSGEASNLLSNGQFNCGGRLVTTNGVWQGGSRGSGFSVGSLSITVVGDGTATINGVDSTSLGRMRVGDYLSSITSFSGRQNSKGTISLRNVILGRVTDMTGSDVTLAGVAYSLTTGTYSVYLFTLGKTHLPSVGDFTSGSTVITNCSNTTGWVAGDIIRTAKFGPMQNGARVVSVGADTITMSLAATKTTTAAHFYDVPLRLVEMTRGNAFGAPSSGDFPPGAFVSAEIPTKDANGMVLTGWICTQGGNPGLWEPVYQSSVSPAA
jgi:hypothetical protein